MSSIRKAGLRLRCRARPWPPRPIGYHGLGVRTRLHGRPPQQLSPTIRLPFVQKAWSDPSIPWTAPGPLQQQYPATHSAAARPLHCSKLRLRPSLAGQRSLSHPTYVLLLTPAGSAAMAKRVRRWPEVQDEQHTETKKNSEKRFKKARTRGNEKGGSTLPWKPCTHAFIIGHWG